MYCSVGFIFIKFYQKDYNKIDVFLSLKRPKKTWANPLPLRIDS